MSKIEWTNITWNPITGCNKVSEGCRNCYAKNMHERLRAMGQEKYKFPFENVIFNYNELGRDFGKKSKMIFVNSMSDTFNEKISDEQINKILGVCRKYPQHIFQLLTKRPERLMRFSYPPNVWLGVTVESIEHVDRIKWLKLADTATVKFLSCEPLLSDLGTLNLSGINWVICGGESGHYARPAYPEWFRNIQKQFAAQDVPFFFKQWGEWVPAWQIPSARINKTTNKIIYFYKNGRFDMSYNGAACLENKYGKFIQMIKTGKAKSGALLDGVNIKNFRNASKEVRMLNFIGFLVFVALIGAIRVKVYIDKTKEGRQNVE